MFVTFITISFFFFFFSSDRYSNLTTIEILVLLSWIPASKEFFQKHYIFLMYLRQKINHQIWASWAKLIESLLLDHHSYKKLTMARRTINYLERPFRFFLKKMYVNPCKLKKLRNGHFTFSIYMDWRTFSKNMTEKFQSKSGQ